MKEVSKISTKEKKTSQRRISSQQMMVEVFKSLRDMHENEGVHVSSVFKYVESKPGATGLTKGRLLTTLERGVQQGYLVKHAGKYNIAAEQDRCGCKPSSSKKKKAPSCGRKVGLIKRILRLLFKRKKKCGKRLKKSRSRCRRKRAPKARRSRKPRC